MSAFHFDRQKLRRTAWAMLVAWLFALTAAAVNACAVAPAGQVERGEVRTDVSAHGGHHHDGKLANHHLHDQDSGKENCLKFCDDGSSAVAKVEPAVVDPGLTLLTTAEPWGVIAATSSAGFWQSRERAASQGPPLVIRFLRLTL